MRQSGIEEIVKCLTGVKLTVLAGDPAEVKAFAVNFAAQAKINRIDVAGKNPSEVLQYVSEKGSEIICEKSATDIIIIDSLDNFVSHKEVALLIKDLYILSCKLNVCLLIIFPCKERSEWESVYFYLPVSMKEDMQFLSAAYLDAEHVALIIERGYYNSGEYILIDCITLRQVESN